MSQTVLESAGELCPRVSGGRPRGEGSAHARVWERACAQRSGGDDRPKKNERADPDSHAASVVSPNDPETPITRRHLGMSSSFLKRKRVVVCLSAVTTYVTLSL